MLCKDYYAGLDITEICQHNAGEDNLITDDNLLAVVVTHSTYNTSFPLVAGMRYQGIKDSATTLS